MFHKMMVNGNNYIICRRKTFIPAGNIEKDDLEKAFNFAYDMSFGGAGEHRHNRSGGVKQRRNGAIFADAFQGKISEFAIYSTFKNLCSITEPDLDVYGLGAWDDCDFLINSKKVSVKSTKRIKEIINRHNTS